MRLNFLYQCSIYDYYCRNMWYSKGTQVAPFTLKFAYYTNRKTSTRKSNSTKGLTYTKMENYIRLYENRDELLNMFYKVRSLSQIQSSPYHFVCNWFFSQFPDYDCIPEFVNGKLYADVYSIPEAKDNGSKISVAA